MSRADAQIEVTCDNCGSKESHELSWRSSGYGNLDDYDLEQSGWIIHDGDFCCENCALEYHDGLVTCEVCLQQEMLPIEAVTSEWDDSDKADYMRGQEWEVDSGDRLFCSVECARDWHGDMYDLVELVIEATNEHLSVD